MTWLLLCCDMLEHKFKLYLYVYVFFSSHIIKLDGPDSLVGCMSDWYSGDSGLDPPVPMEIGHEIISMAILSLPLIQGSCQ